MKSRAPDIRRAQPNRGYGTWSSIVEVDVAASTQPAGIVVFQSPVGGTSAFQTTLVTISVSAAGAPPGG